MGKESKARILKKRVDEIAARLGNDAAFLFLCFLIGAFDQQLGLTDRQFELHLARAYAQLGKPTAPAKTIDVKAQPIDNESRGAAQLTSRFVAAPR
jgi:hypothetical protein